MAGRGKSYPVVHVLQAASGNQQQVYRVGTASLWARKPGRTGNQVPFLFQKHAVMIDQPHGRNIPNLALTFSWHPSLVAGGFCTLY